MDVIRHTVVFVSIGF